MQHTILLVGGTRGIGEALAKRLQATASVWRLSRQPVGDPQHRVWDATADAFPDDLPDRLDGLVYCPGSITLRAFPRLNEADFRRDWEINVLGAVRAIQGALPALRRGSGPGVVLFSSVAAQTGMSMHASVASAKAGVEGLVKSLAAELAPRIRVNAVAPSITDTPLAEPLLKDEAQRKAAAGRHPLQRIGSADEVAALVQFLLSPQAAPITGQVLPVDGGLSSLRLFGRAAG